MSKPITENEFLQYKIRIDTQISSLAGKLVMPFLDGERPKWNRERKAQRRLRALNELLKTKNDLTYRHAEEVFKKMHLRPAR